MSKVDWSLAPHDATHANKKSSDAGFIFYRVNGKDIFRWSDEEKWVESVFLHAIPHWLERPKQAKWSGPKDGLPPVNTECEVRDHSSGKWCKCLILLHDLDNAVFRCTDHSYTFAYDGCVADGFRALKTKEQLAADIRETAIREIMDIADVDCRITAAKLVDAGFKREVV